MKIRAVTVYPKPSSTVIITNHWLHTTHVLHARTATLQVKIKNHSEIARDRYKRIYGENNLHSEITMKRFVKRAFCSVKAETSFF